MSRLILDLKTLSGVQEVAGPYNASVLALFSGEDFARSEILLTKRSHRVATHAGQVAFPGGGLEGIDGGDPVRTALRETEEEVGLPASRLLAVGILPRFPTVTGDFLVTPVIGVADPGVRELPLKPDPLEVAHAAWVPVRKLVETRSDEQRQVRGLELVLPVFDWEGERVWGLTALIFDLILKRYGTLSP